MAKSSRSKAIKKKNANKREKLTKATDQRMQRLAEKLNQVIAADNEDGGLMPLLPTDAESLKSMKIVLDPSRDDDKMDGVEAVSAAPSTNIGKNKRKKIGRK
eukprot:TRINITY_DN4821_c0_g1_i2.p1 TRINITY_DN4821_c0_g1~~TRINITY_DN4821_c0_g1_i2.p1  ORF type:complete len:109 (-),score=33.21 TRINITY_DN4821_c0_g1_i2:157-462(-)